MESSFKDRLVEASVKIGDDILSRTLYDENGAYWETLNSYEEDGTYKTNYVSTGNLYLGTAGIIYLFIALFKETSEEKYRDIIAKAAPWLLNFVENDERDYYAFYTGKLGMAYVLIRCSILLNDEDMRKRALKIVLESDKFLVSENKIDDVINGFSGTVLGLLNVYQLTKEDRIITLLDQYCSTLLKRAVPGKTGLYWDRSHQQIRGLCGFSHGAAGVGAAFLELGKFFENPVLIEITRQAFEYENVHFDKEYLNWPDFRKGVYNQQDYVKAKNAYLSNDLAYFTTAGDMNAWCHGAAGIGLARIRAYEYLKEKVWLEDAEIAVAKTKHTDIDLNVPTRTFCLCHGSAGNADLFLEAGDVLESKEYLNYAAMIGEEVLRKVKAKEKFQAGFAHAKEEDYSLFLGNAGVAYFLLRLASPDKHPSIEYPSLKTTFGKKVFDGTYEVLGITEGRLAELLNAKVFPRTMKFLSSKRINIMTSSSNSFNKYSYYKELKGKASELNGVEKEFYNELLALEYQRMVLDDEQVGASYLDVKRTVNTEAASDLIANEEELLKSKLEFDSAIKLFELSYNQNADGITKLDNSRKILLMPTFLGIAEYNVTPLIESIIEVTKKPVDVHKVVNKVSDLFEEPANNDESVQIQRSILNQVKEMLKIGVLIPIPK